MNATRRFSPAALIVASSMLLASAGPAAARDDRLHLPIEAALAKKGSTKTPFNESIKLYFGDQPHAKPSTTLGEFTANKKTNGVGKSDSEACDWAFLSAVISLQERAVKEGGNAVINVHSVYKNQDFTSTTEYECGAGGVMAGVALRGTVVKLP